MDKRKEWRGCKNDLTEAKDIITTTLKESDNEGTSAPYWIIIDPLRLSDDTKDIHDIAGAITGLFFSRSDAEFHLKARSHAFSAQAKVYCHSGYASEKYMNLCKAIGMGG